MIERFPSSSVIILFLFLCLQLTCAYTPLSDDFLRSISATAEDFDPSNGTLLSPLLIPRVPGTENHTLIQSHLISYFTTNLPKYQLEWQNSTITPTSPNTPIEISNLICRREPPWTVKGQANYLTLAAHYDSLNLEGFVGASEAVPMAVMMFVARSIDAYMTQMHDEMDALGEGGTVAMDMGIQFVFLDGRENLDSSSRDPGLYGSKSLAAHWENSINPAEVETEFKYPNTLSQISIFVLLDALGFMNSMVPSYALTTHWVYQNLAAMEERMRNISVLETNPPPAWRFFPEADVPPRIHEVADDNIPFMQRGIPFLHLLPSPLPVEWHTVADNEDGLDGKSVRDWARVMVGFVCEWLDMMEVWPE